MANFESERMWQKRGKNNWMDKMREQQKKLWQQTFDGDSTIYSPFIFI